MKNENGIIPKKSYYELLQKEIKNSYKGILLSEFNKEIILSFDKFVPSKRKKKMKINGLKIHWKSFLLDMLSTGENKSWKTIIYNYIQNDYNKETVAMPEEKYLLENEIFFKQFCLRNFPGQILIDTKNSYDPILSSFSGQDQLKKYAENSKEGKNLKKETVKKDKDKDKFQSKIELTTYKEKENKKIKEENININKPNDDFRTFSYFGSLENNTTFYSDNETDEKKQNKYHCYQIRKHISIIRMQLEKPNSNHPIIKIINFFSEFYVIRLKKYNKNYASSTKGSMNDSFQENIIETKRDIYKNFEDESLKEIDEMKKDVINEIQNFVEIIAITLKLFYSKVINYDSFIYERDEFINLICYFLFKKKNFYENLFKLFELSNKEKQEQLNNKKKETGKITPKDIGISIKFRLNEETKNLKEKKNDYGESLIITSNGEESTGINTIKINEENPKKIGIVEYFKTIEITETKKISSSFSQKRNKIKIDDLIDNSSSENEINSESKNSKKQSTNDEHEIENRIRHSNTIKIQKYQDFSDTINSLNTTLKEQITIDMEDNPADIEFPNIEDSEIDLNNPYKETINYIETIKDLKTPLDKLTIIALTSVLITDYIDNFWKGKEGSLPDDYLRIDSDELLSIFLYIIYKMNTESIYTHLDFIQHFTGTITKRSLTGYFYTTVDGCLKYIMNAKTKEDLSRNDSFK